MRGRRRDAVTLTPTGWTGYPFCFAAGARKSARAPPVEEILIPAAPPGKPRAGIFRLSKTEILDVQNIYFGNP